MLWRKGLDIGEIPEALKMGGNAPLRRGGSKTVVRKFTRPQITNCVVQHNIAMQPKPACI